MRACAQFEVISRIFAVKLLGTDASDCNDFPLLLHLRQGSVYLTVIHWTTWDRVKDEKTQFFKSRVLASFAVAPPWRPQLNIAHQEPCFRKRFGQKALNFQHAPPVTTAAPIKTYSLRCLPDAA
jgi:hypothetical protein